MIRIKSSKLIWQFKGEPEIKAVFGQGLEGALWMILKEDIVNEGKELVKIEREVLED